MDPELGEVTEEEGEAVDVRAVAAEQRRRRRRRRRQMARRAAEEEVEAEFNRRLAREVMDTCNSNELELLFPVGPGREQPQLHIHPPGPNGVVSLIVMTEVLNFYVFKIVL